MRQWRNACRILGEIISNLNVKQANLYPAQEERKKIQIHNYENIYLPCNLSQETAGECASLKQESRLREKKRMGSEKRNKRKPQDYHPEGRYQGNSWALCLGPDHNKKMRDAGEEGDVP